MQVSWIDADEVRDLVALLAEPAAGAGSAAPDLDSLPETGDRYGFALLTEKAAPIPPQPVSIDTATAPAVDEAAALPDLSHIRERLRAIRDRAQEAGLLSKETPAERAARVPAPPRVMPQPEPPAPAPTPTPPPAPQGLPPSPPSPPTPKAVVEAAQTTTEELTIVERLDEFARWCAKVTTSEELFMLDEHGDLIWGCPTSDDLLICAKLAMNASMRSHAATLANATASTPMQVGPGKELQLVSCPTIHGNVMVALVNARQVPAASLREGLALALSR